jgi:hypothetical protein
MNYKMIVDPRCRHIAGLTIEGTQARFWHCDRSVVAVSEPFDFVKVMNSLQNYKNQTHTF